MSAWGRTMRRWTPVQAVGVGRAASAIAMLAFALATSVGAQVAVPLPFTAVPVTLQAFVVILAGAVLGPWRGAGAMAIYLAAGAAGAPVFSAGHGGFPWLLGPTGGYLLACPAAAFSVGAIRGSGGVGGGRLLAALASGIVLLYAGGVSQLWILTAQPFSAVLAQGVWPFLPGDAAKVLLAFGLTRGFGRDTRDGD